MRCSSMGCSFPMTVSSVRWTAAGRWRWAPWHSSGSLIATGRVNTTGAVNDLIREIVRAHKRATAPHSARDPLVRQRIADLYGRALVHYSDRTARHHRGSPAADPRARSPRSGSCSFARWWRTSPTSGWARCMGGSSRSLKSADGSTKPHQRWLRLAYQARGTAIAGGSTFIQRNIVAERILGMPRG